MAPKAKIDKDLIHGKTILITGANSGIGKATVEEIVREEAAVVLMGCRTKEKAQEAIESIRKQYPNSKTELIFIRIVLDDLNTIMKAVEEIEANEKIDVIDVLINNAGVFMQTPDKIKMFESNHLGHFFLTDLLIKRKLMVEKHAKIVVLSSKAHTFAPVKDMKKYSLKEYIYSKETPTPSSMRYYGLTKLLNMWHVRKLEEEFHDAKDMYFYLVHPGAVSTNIGYSNSSAILKPLVWFLNLFFKSPVDGAQTTLHCGFSKQAHNESNQYYSDCHVENYKEYANDPKRIQELWDLSIEKVKEVFPDYVFAHEKEEKAQQPSTTTAANQSDEVKSAQLEEENIKSTQETNDDADKNKEQVPDQQDIQNESEEAKTTNEEGEKDKEKDNEEDHEEDKKE